MMELKVLKDKRFGLIMISSFIWGLIAHGPAMFSKFSFHDDIGWFNGVGVTYELGRWCLGICDKVFAFLLGSIHYSTPAFNGALTIAAVALIVYLLVLKLDINSRVLIIALSGVFVCFPAITNIFGFVYTAPYYYIAAFFGAYGAYMFFKRKDTLSIIICVNLMALSVGIYQSNIPVNMICLLLFMLVEVCDLNMAWKDFLILTGKCALICFCFMAEYFAFNAVFLRVVGTQMYEYKGVSSFGMTGFSDYIKRIIISYKRFVRPIDFINYDGVSANMFPWGIRYYHMILIVIVFALIIFWLRRIGAREKIAQIALLLVASPLFAYFLYVMTGEEDSHGGMAFGEVFMFALAAFIIERMKDSGKVADIAGKISVGIMIFIAVMFVRFANVCYLKAEVIQSQAISYFNTLIAKIQTTEGYTEDTPVVYVGDSKKNEAGLGGEKYFSDIYLPPFQGKSLINDFLWEETMELWCGFTPEHGEIPEGSSDEVSEMPVYPAEGSVKMIDDVLVVKFSD